MVPIIKNCYIFCYLWKIVTFSVTKVFIPFAPSYYNMYVIGVGVSLQSRCRWHLTLFIWVHYYNYLILSAFFSCTLSYMQQDYNRFVLFYFLYIHSIIGHLTLFVSILYYNYLLLSASFSSTLSYMQHDYYQRTSYQCVTSHIASLPIILSHILNSGTEFAV
jgi:hypothetical protein